jgi:tetratricopeptide (TPR) repeat protein
MIRLPLLRAGLVPLPSLAAALMFIFTPVTAGAVSQAFDPSRPWDRSAVGADAVASKPVGKRSPAERVASDGFEQLLAGRLAEAEAAFGKALEVDAKFTPALLGLADVRLRQRRPAEAEGFIKRALALEPGSADAYTALGRFQFGQGRYEEAKAAYLKALQLDPQAFLAHLDLADLYASALRDPRAAEQQYRKALALKPGHTPARIGLALALLSGGQQEAALTELQSVTKAAPRDPTAWHLIGRIRAAQGQFGEAALALSEALRVQADFMPALLDRADVYAEMGDDNKAAVDYERAIKLNPRDAVSRVKLGMIYQRTGQAKRAEDAYRAALRLDPSLAPAANNLAMMILRAGGNLDEALALARKAVAASPQVPQFHDTLGRVLRARGTRAAAIAAFEKATTLPPPLADPWYQLGQLHEEAGNRAGAIAAYRKALELDPKAPEATAARARLQALGR